MTFEEILDHAIAMLQRRGRLTYGTLKRQFQLDEDALHDLTDALLYAHPEVHDDAGRGIVWTGAPASTPLVASTPVGRPAREPLSYTPAYLTEKILTSRSALEGERKQVTVLFADLKGSMELLADRDPEDARQLLDPVLEQMMAAVHRYEGTVNQVMGDGIMALFGAPIAHEDHAVRACYAALAMQEAIRRYSEEVRRLHGVEVQIRVGLNSGEVVVRTIGNDLHMDYSAIGQTTHLAARMEQLAPPGSIRLTADTLRLAEGWVQVTPLGPVPVKGLLAPVEVCELVGAGPARTRRQAFATRGLTPFVGRQAELTVLHQALEQAGTGHGQVVAVIGEPGVGKTRLFYEFTHASRTQGWLRLESSSTSYGKATPYQPVIDLLKAYFQLEDRDEERRRREKITGRLLTLDPALGPTLPAFLALLEVPVEGALWQALEPSQRRQRTLDALKRLFLRESQVQPLLLVFENLHWIDAETQAFLDGLMESLPATRQLLLVNYRPEYQHSWSHKTYYIQLRLDPLPPASSEALLQSLLGEAPGLEPLKQRLITRTQGNPFFLEESVRTLVETQVLIGEQGAYRLAKTPTSIQVPATVQAVLAARIDRLPPEDKALLQTAAVIGTEVPFALLHAIVDASDEALYRSLAQLQAAEFLYETSLFPEHAYTFKHALTHQVAYENLLQEQRRGFHAQIVEALEALHHTRLAEQVDRVAHHALRAEAWTKALPYCQQAGAKAFARSANWEAIAWFEQALTALHHLPESHDTHAQAIDLQLDLCNAMAVLGEYGRMGNHMHEAETLAEALDDQRRLGRVSVALTQYYCMIGLHEHAVEASQRALALAEALGDMGMQVTATINLSQVYYLMGNYERAMAFLRQNLTALGSERLQERFGLYFLPAVYCRTRLVFCLADVGAFAESRAIAEEAIRMAEAVDHPLSRTAVYGALGALYLRQGGFDKAIPVLEQALELAQADDIRVWFSWNASHLGYAYALSGRVAEALPLLQQAVEQEVARGRMVYHARWVAWLSEGYLVAGHIEEATPLAWHALEFSRDHKERGHEAYARRLLGAIAIHREPMEVAQAETHYQQALALAAALQMRPLQAHCHLGLGTLYATTGQREQARAALSIAMALYRAMDMTFWLLQTETALAQVEER